VPGVSHLRLGVNIDHVATIRNARGGRHPDPLRAAHLAVEAGADGITAHLREDRRHISDDDIARLKRELTRPLNFEMAATDEMLVIALRHVPHACCLVPEKREERTTEGGLDVVRGENHLRQVIESLRTAGIRVSLFIDAEPHLPALAAEAGADRVEIYTGPYGGTFDPRAKQRELDKVVATGNAAKAAGLGLNAGHDLTRDNLPALIAALPHLAEVSIGHAIIADALTFGIGETVRLFRAACGNPVG